MVFLHLQKISGFLALVCIIGMAMLLSGHPFLYDRLRLLVWVFLLIGVVCHFLIRGQVQKLCPSYVIWALAIWGSSIVFSVIGQVSEDVWSYYVGVFLFILVGMVVGDDFRSVKWVAIGVLGGAGAVSVYGLLQFYHLDPWPSDSVFRQIGRVVGTFKNPNHFGNYVAICLPIGLAIFFQAHLQKVAYASLGLCGLCYAGLLLSGSRGAWVAGLLGGMVVVGGIGVQAWWRGKPLPWYRFVIVSAMFLAITLWFADKAVVQTPSGSVGVGERLLSTKNIVEVETERDVGVNHRYWIWKITWQMIQDAPVFGQGYGTFGEKFVEIRGHLQEMGALNVALEDVSFAHNEYLHIWAEGGLFGLVGFIGLVGVIIIAALKRVCYDDEMQSEIWGGLGLVGAMLTHSLVSYPLHLELNSMVFWFTLGVLAKSGYANTEGTQKRHVGALARSYVGTFPSHHRDLQIN